MIFWRDLAAAVTSFLGGARLSVVIAAPFIKIGALERLLAAVSVGVRIEIFTRWQPDEVAAGVSDPGILRVASARGASVHLVDELHAKLFVIDNCEMLAGSANVTASALGLARRSNLELLVPVVPAPQELALFLSELRFRSRAATEDEMERVLSLAARMPEAACLASDRPDDRTDIDLPAPSSRWLPRFRSPDRLYGLYADPDYLFRATALDHALADLSRLSMPAGLSERAFNDRARQALRENPVVVELNEFATEPRRFGEISGWLTHEMPDADHSVRQAAAQVLIRWLTYFDGRHYSLETPNYTEVFLYRP